MNAVITGASKGIGKAIAEKLAAEGFNVIICARSADTLAAARADILKKNPAITVMAETVDMGDKAQVLAFAQKIKANYTSIDILVNNAGIFIPGALHKEEDGLLEKLMAVNVYSAYHLTRELLPLMISQRNGHIFNMCSTASHHAYPNGGSYSITKYALLGFTKNLRQELLQYDIRVTAVSPGPTLTASWEGFDAPPNRMMPPEDIASVIWSAFSLAKQTVIEEILLRPMLGDI